MTRAQFLKQLWQKGIKPVFLIVAIYFCIRFIIDVFNNDGTAQFVTVLVLGLAFLFTLFYFIGLLFKFLAVKISTILPEHMKTMLKSIGKIIEYLVIPALAIIAFHFWQTDRKSGAVIVGFFLLQHVIVLVKGEKPSK